MIPFALAVSVIVMIFGINDMFRFDAERWASAGRRRPMWVVLTLGFGPLAVLLYWGTVRYQLRYPERYADPS